VSLDLVVLSPNAASSEDDALAMWVSESEGDPEDPALAQFASEIDERFTDEEWPFTGDPIVCSDHVSLVIAPEEWERVVPEIVDLAHRNGLIVLDPQYGGEAKLFPPGASYE